MEQPAYQEQKPQRSFKLGLSFILGILVTGLILGVYYFFFSHSGPKAGQPIPLIEADTSPVKILPDSSAQPEVPHKDKLIYARFNPSELEGKVERLLPLPEDPIDTAEYMTETQSQHQVRAVESIVEPITGIEEDEVIEEKPEPTVDVFPAVVEPPEAPTITEQTEVAMLLPLPKPSYAKEDPTAPIPDAIPSQKALRHGYRIQLASMKSPELARSEWNRLKVKYKDVFHSLSPHIARIDLGAKKGVYYRVMAGDFKSKASADKACIQMKAQTPKADCLVVKF